MDFYICVLLKSAPSRTMIGGTQRIEVQSEIIVKHIWGNSHIFKVSIMICEVRVGIWMPIFVLLLWSIMISKLTYYEHILAVPL